jgi:hypothetical protein
MLKNENLKELRKLQGQGGGQENTRNIPTLFVNYTVTLPTVASYSSAIRSLENAVKYSTLFTDVFTLAIIDQAGSSNPLLAFQIASTSLTVSPPLSVLQRPTMTPTQAQTLAIPINEQTPFDLKGKVPSDYIEQKTNKYFYSYVITFIGIVCVLCVGRLIYLLHLHVNKPNTLLASAAGSNIYEPFEAPPKMETQR